MRFLVIKHGGSLTKTTPVLLFLLTLFAPGAFNAHAQTVSMSDTPRTADRLARISALPNPVPAGMGQGITQIAWQTGDDSPGEVRVSSGGEPERLFARGAQGSQSADWITPGAICEFRLYSGTEPHVLLASVTVTGSAEMPASSSELAQAIRSIKQINPLQLVSLIIILLLMAGVYYALRTGKIRLSEILSLTVVVLAVICALLPLLLIEPRPLAEQPFPDAQELSDTALQLARGEGYITYTYLHERHPPRSPPGFPLLLAPFAAFGGEFPASVQTGAKLFAVSYVLFVVFAAWRMGGRLAAALVATLIGISPFASTYASLVLSDAFAAGVIALILALLHRPSPRLIALAGALAGALVAVRLPMALNLAALFIALPTWALRRHLTLFAAPFVVALGLFNWKTFGGVFRTGYSYWMPHLKNFDWIYAFAALPNRDGPWVVADALGGLLLQWICPCPAGGPQSALPNIIFYPAILLGAFWVFAPPLVTLLGLVFVWTQRGETAAKFTLWLTLMSLMLFTFYFAQGTRFMAAPATLLVIYSSIGIARFIERHGARHSAGANKDTPQNSEKTRHDFSRNKGMEKHLRHKLAYPVRNFARRVIVRVVGWVVYVISDLWNIAVANGLDVERVTPFAFKLNLLEQQPVAQLELPGADPSNNAAPLLKAEDFLFLMDAVACKINATDARASRIKSSIIIPVFNKADYTLQCIRALMARVDLTENEIIVVDNASTDETARVLEHLKNFVRVVSNEKNLGFVHACNVGARQARGKFIVFLNNDTVVEPGWLENLVETAEADETVGAVGSMLIYPDGRLQEAGCGVWNDGTAFNYGRNQDPQDRKYNFLREVDYCSAASLLIRKDLFDKVGGFDTQYAPAYYEDTDLCFSISSLGYKVLYQPASQVTHFEGVTAGTDTSAGFKRFQEINRELFVKKWSERLRRKHLVNDPDSMGMSADRRRGARIIVFDREIPTPDQDSGSLRMFMILKTLAQRYRPVFVPVYASFQSPQYEQLLGKEGVEVISLSDYKKLIKSGEIYAAILSRAEVADALLPIIHKLDRNIKIIYDTVDVHFLRLQREHELTGNKDFMEEAVLRRKQEVRATRLADQVWCVTEDDRQVLQSEVPSANIEIVPNIHPLQESGKNFEERDGLLFIGNFNHRPNKDAIHYFLEKIFPRIKEKIGRVKFYIVGSNMPDDIKAYESEDVAVLGYVPDVAPIFHRRRVFVVPLRYGAGMKGKVGQALSYGLPVVTTSIGAEGIGLRDDDTALITDEPEEFAQAVCKVYTDPEQWQRLADNGYSYVREHLSQQSSVLKAFNMLNKNGN